MSSRDLHCFTVITKSLLVTNCRILQSTVYPPENHVHVSKAMSQTSHWIPLVVMVNIPSIYGKVGVDPALPTLILLQKSNVIYLGPPQIPRRCSWVACLKILTKTTCTFLGRGDAKERHRTFFWRNPMAQGNISPVKLLI